VVGASDPDGKTDVDAIGAATAFGVAACGATTTGTTAGATATTAAAECAVIAAVDAGALDDITGAATNGIGRNTADDDDGRGNVEGVACVVGVGLACTIGARTAVGGATRELGGAGLVCTAGARAADGAARELGDTGAIGRDDATRELGDAGVAYAIGARADDGAALGAAARGSGTIGICAAWLRGGGGGSAVALVVGAVPICQGELAQGVPGGQGAPCIGAA
jgi:hypothetical protein